MNGCLIEYYACYGLSIAFPELAVPAIVEVRDFPLFTSFASNHG
jgi:hypothetical protein